MADLPRRPDVSYVGHHRRRSYTARHAQDWWNQTRMFKLQFWSLLVSLTFAMVVLIGILVRDVIL